MHLLLLIPSSLLLILLFAHCWHYRGRQAALTFFGACFAFGVLRGNLIHAIITRYFGGETLPYLFTRPVVKIGYASLQECVGWIFALYLSWSIAERLLAGKGKNSAPLFRVIGLASFLMGAIAYAVETAAAAVQWWVWTMPIKNPFFFDVPFAGIIAWISVGFDFLGPFLLLYYGGYTHRARYLLLALFPVHMLCHMKLNNIAAWMPMNPAEIWHWLMLCALIYGLAAGGPALAVPPGSGQDRAKPLVRHAVWGTVAGFVLVLAIVHASVGNPRLAISLVPFITCALFVYPAVSACFCTGSCLIYGLVTGGWTYTLVPLAILALFGFSIPQAADKLSPSWRKWSTAVILTACTVMVYYQCAARSERYSKLAESVRRMESGTAPTDQSGVEKLLLTPRKTGDAVHYYIYGNKLLRRGILPAARRLLEESVACDSTYPFAYFNLALAYRATGNTEAAIRAYERGLELNPIEFQSYPSLGDLYQAAGSPDKAEALYRRGLRYDSQRLDLVLALERLLHRQGRQQEATALLKEHLPGKGDALKLMSTLAAGLAEPGRVKDAEAAYVQGIRQDITHLYAAATSLALIYWRELGQPDSGLAYVNLAAAVQPTAEIMTIKGAILQSLGRDEEADEAYRAAASLKKASAGEQSRQP